MILFRSIIPAVLFSIFVGCGGTAPSPVAVAVVPVTSEQSPPPLDNSDGADDTPKVSKDSGAKDHKRKVAECNALIGVINHAVDELNRVSSSSAPNSTGTGDYEVMAETMARAGVAASKAKINDKRLKTLADQYKAMAQQVANSSRALVLAANAHDVAKVNAAKADVEKAVKQEDPIVDAINAYCQQP